MENNPFKGKICFSPRKNAKAKNNFISFDVTKKTHFEFNDYLMCEFKGLQLTSDEKINLTHLDREIIKRYQRVEDQTITELSKKLIKAIKKAKTNKLYISAEDFGVYICLAAIFSGEMPENMEIIFELSNTPLAIFPKKLIKREPGDNLYLNFRVNQESWISPFRSLYTDLPKRVSVPNLKVAA